MIEILLRFWVARCTLDCALLWGTGVPLGNSQNDGVRTVNKEITINTKMIIVIGNRLLCMKSICVGNAFYEITTHCGYTRIT